MENDFATVDTAYCRRAAYEYGRDILILFDNFWAQNMNDENYGSCIYNSRTYLTNFIDNVFLPPDHFRFPA